MHPDYTEIVVPCITGGVHVHHDLLPIAPNLMQGLCRSILSTTVAETTNDNLVEGLLDHASGRTYCLEIEATAGMPAIALVALLPPLAQTIDSESTRLTIDRQLIRWVEEANGKKVSSGKAVVDHAEIPFCFSAGDFAVIIWEGKLFQSPLEDVGTC